MLVSVTDRDAPAHTQPQISGIESLNKLAAALRERGLDVECREVCANDVEVLGTAWGKRLGIPRLRPGWLLEARKA
ncbi:MAG: hypothetical protein JO318_08790 [Chloroflexi bacterium]|nr:hypothetical protein [Chloroflexota bacterium]MBV9132783.1 hypothetical protein [Chloroflexota bacterium]